MKYEVILINDPYHQNHWNAMQPYIVQHHHVKAKFQNPHIVGSWAHKLGFHDWIYCIHVKTGHLGNHHHFTITYEVRNGMYKLLDIHEGHKTFW